MHEKRNKRLMIIGGILLGGIVLSSLLMSRPASFEVEKDYFRKTDLKTVDRIVLETRSGKVKLDYQSNRWRVNEAFAADRNLVDVLFATLQQVEPKRPVATSLQDSITDYLVANAVKVSLFSGDSEAGQFYAGGNTTKTQAYFLKEGETTPYIVVIPGYRVYASGIFEVPPMQWREKTIFDFNWTNFKQLEVAFKNPDGDFLVEFQKNLVSVKGISEPDTARLNTFLDQLSLLTVEEFVEQNSRLDSLAATKPLADYTITDIGGRTYGLKVYALENQFLAVIQKNVFAILAEEKIVPLLRPKQFFIKR